MNIMQNSRHAGPGQRIACAALRLGIAVTVVGAGLFIAPAAYAQTNVPVDGVAVTVPDDQSGKTYQVSNGGALTVANGGKIGEPANSIHTVTNSSLAGNGGGTLFGGIFADGSQIKLGTDGSGLPAIVSWQNKLISLDNGSAGIFDNVQITATNPAGGFAVTVGDSTLSMGSRTILNVAGPAVGVQVNAGGQADIVGSKITADNTPLQVTGGSAVVTGASLTGGDTGAVVEQGGSLVIHGSMITGGPNAALGTPAGVAMAPTDSTGTTILAINQGSNISGVGLDGVGLFVVPFGGVAIASVADSNISGSQNGIRIDGSFLANPAAVVMTLDRSSITGGAEAIRVDGGGMDGGITASITVQNGTTLAGGNGVILNVLNSASLDFKAIDVMLTGDIKADDTSTVNAFLTNKTTLTGAVDPVNMSIDDTSRWNVTGDSTLNNLTNAGTVAFLPPVGGVFKTITATNYIGQGGGTIGFNTFLGADNSPSDKLVINVGKASGTTIATFTNAGGPGAQTVADGIPVVVTTNGGTTDKGAFSLGGRVAAGPYEYLLLRTDKAGAGDNWFLRSHLVDTTDPDRPVTPDRAIFRAEVPVYSPLSDMARQTALVTLGTFHDRQGDQGLLRGAGYLPASWGRGFGQHTERGWSGTVSPEFEGNIAGFQAGQDLFAMQDRSGDRDRFGFFVGYASTSGDMSGFALGQLGFNSGRVSIDGTSFGGYWTHIGPSGWYVDAVAMGTWFDGNANSHFGTGIGADGSAFTGSLEGGYPVRLGWGLTLEPQAQIVWQNLSLDSTRDRFSSVAFSDEGAWTGRLGARLLSSMYYGAASWSPYLKANLWHRFSGTDTVIFGDIHPIVANQDSTALELGGGIVGKLTGALDLYASASYTTDVDDSRVQTWGGNIGLRYTW